MGETRRPWPGGYIHRQSDGQDLFIIERRSGGKRWHLSTRCHNLRAAMKHLERFEVDAAAYERSLSAGAPQGAGAVRMTGRLVDEFHDWLTTREHPTTQKYANEMAARLKDWMKDLGGADLRHVQLETLKQIVAARKTCRQHRIIALKAFCGWLRSERFLLRRQEDASLDLSVPQAVPEKHRRRKAVPFEDVRKVLAALAPAYRDCLLLLARTGWHVTELERFAREESAAIAEGRADTLAVLQVRHKSGAITRTPVLDPEVLAAARRIRERQEVPRRLNDAIKSGCATAGVAEFTLGVMRHSVATWAIEAGTAPDVVAEFLGHKSKATTLKFYADVAVPTPPVKLPSL